MRMKKKGSEMGKAYVLYFFLSLFRLREKKKKSGFKADFGGVLWNLFLKIKQCFLFL